MHQRKIRLDFLDAIMYLDLVLSAGDYFSIVRRRAAIEFVWISEFIFKTPNFSWMKPWTDEHAIILVLFPVDFIASVSRPLRLYCLHCQYSFSVESIRIRMWRKYVLLYSIEQRLPKLTLSLLCRFDNLVYISKTLFVFLICCSTVASEYLFVMPLWERSPLKTMSDYEED